MSDDKASEIVLHT